MSQCSCLLPAYNEEKRIVQVITELQKCTNLSEIVVVSDGSTDDTAKIVSQRFPNLPLLVLPQNLGKVGAVRKGVELINSPYVFLCDADLQYLKSSEIDAAISTTINNNHIDMVIMRRINEIYDLIVRIEQKLRLPKQGFEDFFRPQMFSNISCLLSGERVLRTLDLQKTLELDVENYQLEIAINQYLIDQNKTACWMPSSATNSYKVKELGTADFFSKYFKMHADIISYLGIKKYYVQLNAFCNDECSAIIKPTDS